MARRLVQDDETDEADHRRRRQNGRMISSPRQREPEEFYGRNRQKYVARCFATFLVVFDHVTSTRNAFRRPVCGITRFRR